MNSIPVLLMMLFCAGGFFLIGKGIIALRDAGESANWPRVPAVVTSSRLEASATSRSSSNFAPKINYRYQANGQEYTGGELYFGSTLKSNNRATAQSIVDRYPEGQPIEIAHHPLQPEKSVIEPGRTKRTWGLFLFGLLFVSISVQVALLIWTQS